MESMIENKITSKQMI